MTLALRIVAGLAIGYLLLGALIACGQRRILYLPANDLPDRELAGVADMDEVTVTTDDGLALLAWHRPPATPTAPTILYLHGNAGNIEHRGGKMRPYLDAGYGVLLLSWRGYGGNPGRPSETGLYTDARAALAFLHVRGVAADRVVLYGESIGSGPAVQLASEEDVGALVLEAPFTSVADVAQHHYWYLPARYLVRDRFASIDKIGRVGAPILILHGKRDRVVPVTFGRALLGAAPGPKEGAFFAEAGHNDLYEHGAQEAILDFLERRLL